LHNRLELVLRALQRVTLTTRIATGKTKFVFYFLLLRKLKS